MTETEFTNAVQTLLDGARGNMQVMTGLPAIDETNDQLRFTRALEILEKIISLKDSSTPAELKALEWANRLSTDLPTFRTSFMKHWSEKRVQQQKR